MSLPGMGDGAAPVKRSSEYEYIAKDIAGPARKKRSGSGRWAAAALQLFFGYVGAGYFFLGDRKKAVYSAFAFIVGASAILLIEMLIFPSETEVNYSLMALQYAAYVIFFALATAYIASIYDCYKQGMLAELKGAAGSSMASQKITREENLERVFGEHDDRASDKGEVQ